MPCTSLRQASCEDVMKAASPFLPAALLVHNFSTAVCVHVLSNLNLNSSVKTAPQIPSRRALAGLAVVTVLSTIEKRRKQQENRKEQDKPPIEAEDMSGELQTIPARHGVATFVPRGRTIKVINTYGKQVVSMWAFTLGAPPEEGDEDGPGAEGIEEEAKKLQEAAEKEEGQGEKQEPVKPAKEESTEPKSDVQTEEKKEQPKASKAGGSNEDHEDPPEQAPGTPDNEKTAETAEKSTKDAAESTKTASKQPSKRTWASYLPSIPYRSKGKGDQAEKADPGAEQEPSPEEQKAQNEANTKKWSSYIPTGKGFSSYIPNVEVPSKEGVVSAFKSSHYRDPNKSYAEQLYDFSKTPVGAGTIAGKLG